jgi:hypothetical protein
VGKEGRIERIAESKEQTEWNKWSAM